MRRPAKPPRLTLSDEHHVDGQSSTARLTDAADTGPVSVTGPVHLIDGCGPVTVSLLCTEPDAGLGFDITGDDTGAVYVRDVFEHGPATQTGNIRPGY